MTIARAIVADLAADPEALAELRRLVADASPVDARLLTAAEVGERLRVSARTVNRWASHGDLEGSKCGKGWRFTTEAIAARETPRSGPRGTAPPPARPRRVQPRTRSSVADAIRGG